MLCLRPCSNAQLNSLYPVFDWILFLLSLYVPIGENYPMEKVDGIKYLHVWNSKNPHFLQT